MISRDCSSCGQIPEPDGGRSDAPLPTCLVLVLGFPRHCRPRSAVSVVNPGWKNSDYFFDFCRYGGFPIKAPILTEAGSAAHLLGRLFEVIKSLLLRFCRRPRVPRGCIPYIVCVYKMVGAAARTAGCASCTAFGASTRSCQRGWTSDRCVAS